MSFTQLIQKYPTWSELSSYLSSEAGGKFSIRDSEESPLAIIWYKKKETILTPENGNLRSVVWDKANNRPVSVAPAKAENGFPPVTTDLTVSDFIDGVMINVFKYNDVWQISTRSQLAASGKFYSDKTFAEMFNEALKNTPIADLVTDTTSYLSFVLQHPEHRMVAKVKEPKLYLVEAGQILSDGQYKAVPLQSAVVKTDLISFSKSFTKNFETENDIWELMRSESQSRGWTWQGFVFHDPSGKRWRMRNATFIYLRNLLGNESQAVQRFLRLRSSGKVREYLRHFSEDRDLFWGFEQELRKRTAQIFDGYTFVHKMHTKTLADLPQPDKTVVFKLHAHYLAHLREKKQSILMRDVIDLINTLPLWEQALLMRQPVTA